MQREIICLMGVLALALVVARTGPDAVEADPPSVEAQAVGNPEPQPAPAQAKQYLPLKPSESLAEPLGEIHRVCGMDAEQLARGRDILEVARHRRARWEQQLWDELSEAQQARQTCTTGPQIARAEKNIRTLRQRCRQLGREEIRAMLSLLRPQQRQRWTAHQLCRRVLQQCQRIHLLPSQEVRIRTLCRSTAEMSPPGQGQEQLSQLHQQVMEAVYLNVFDRKQRMDYAAAVAEQTRQWRLARQEGSQLELQLDEPPE